MPWYSSKLSGCAVYGGIYVLGQFGKPTLIDANDEDVTLKLPCHPRPVTAKYLVSSPNHLPPSLLIPESEPSISNITAHGIVITSSIPEILQRKLPFTDDENERRQIPEENDDTGLIVFPPENGNPTVRCLINGEGTGSCPSKQCKCAAGTRQLAPDSVPRHSLSQLSGIDRIFTVRSPQTVLSANHFGITL